MEKYEPILFSQKEAQEIAKELGSNSLMGKTLKIFQASLEEDMKKPLDVPGQGEAGGYEHDRHKRNYHFMNIAARFYLITKDKRYFNYVRNLLLRYADVYLKLPFHEQKNTNPPGRLFHQILNEHMWLLYSSLAYSCISNDLSKEDRGIIEDKIFNPMLKMFTEKYHYDFDRIHNHGLWAVAAVGICGYATNQKHYVDVSIYGLQNDGTGGFLAQLEKLFSPDGYYVEGPYYHRFALRPLCLFAEAIERRNPEIKIFEHKNKVIKRTINTMLGTAYPNGKFPALNNASRSMGITDQGAIIASALSFKRYEEDQNLISASKVQDLVWINEAGLKLSKACDAQGYDNIPPFYMHSRQYNEGVNGKCGAVGFLRLRKEKQSDISMVAMPYGQHGMGHGHFDTLGITLFNRGQEVFNEYGFGRFVNVEPKFGGRYLPEGTSYSKQTVAHNIVVVDELCQNDSNVEKADSVHGEPHFFIRKGEDIRSMSAFANNHYEGVKQQRSVILYNHDEFEYPLFIDVFRLESQQEHNYDYTFHYQGQIIETNFKYKIENSPSILGEKAGYQHLFKIAEGNLSDNPSISFLQNNSYYSWMATSSNKENAKLVFAQIGANDPDFNLRREPLWLLRNKGKDHIFASVLETHGYFNEATEESLNARGQIENIQVIAYSNKETKLEIITKKSIINIVINNTKNVDEEKALEITTKKR